MQPVGSLLAPAMRLLLAAALVLALAAPAGAQTQGRLTGGIVYALPDWFKASLLDLREDVDDARKANRHVLLFLHLDECPYCARMLKESFVEGDNQRFLRAHFDVIAINVRGASEVTWTDGKQYTERAFVRQLKAFGTPTLVFLGPRGDVVLKLVGYRDSAALRDALDYVQSAAYRSQPFTAYVASRRQPAGTPLRDDPRFARVTDFKGYRKPLAIVFENRQCAECARFHEKTLDHPDVVAELKQFLLVRLDTDSGAPVVDLDGKSVTPAQWAKALDLSYRPAVVLYNEGRETVRIDTHLYHYHFKERLRYVSGEYYKRDANLSQYGAARRAELLKQGIDIDYSE
jgi:thioredoxin-related protein